MNTVAHVLSVWLRFCWNKFEIVVTAEQKFDKRVEKTLTAFSWNFGVVGFRWKGGKKWFLQRLVLDLTIFVFWDIDDRKQICS